MEQAANRLVELRPGPAWENRGLVDGRQVGERLSHSFVQRLLAVGKCAVKIEGNQSLHANRPKMAVGESSLPRAAIGRPPSCIGATASSIRSEEHTSELQSLMRISYAVFCLKKKIKQLTTY